MRILHNAPCSLKCAKEMRSQVCPMVDLLIALENQLPYLLLTATNCLPVVWLELALKFFLPTSFLTSKGRKEHMILTFSTSLASALVSPHLNALMHSQGCLDMVLWPLGLSLPLTSFHQFSAWKTVPLKSFP